MNPGPLEEGGKVIGGFMHAMKDQPLGLAMVVTNLTLLALFFYVVQVATSNKAKEFEAIMRQQAEVQQLLYNCTPTNPRGPG
jgi:hypothetical protein